MKCHCSVCCGCLVVGHYLVVRMSWILVVIIGRGVIDDALLFTAVDCAVKTMMVLSLAFLLLLSLCCYCHVVV